MQVGAKPFQLASPMQWKHVIFTARVEGPTGFQMLNISTLVLECVG